MPRERAKKPKMIDQSRVVICRASVSGLGGVNGERAVYQRVGALVDLPAATCSRFLQEA